MYKYKREPHSVFKKKKKKGEKRIYNLRTPVVHHITAAFVFQASASCDGSVVVWNIEEQVHQHFSTFQLEKCT